MKGKFILIFILSLFFVQGVKAQKESAEFRVVFPVNSVVVDSAYSHNRASIQEIVSFLLQVSKDSTLNVEKVSFCGSSSPEGSEQVNRKLARGRLEALEKVVRDEVYIPDSLIVRDDSYISWGYMK